MCSDKEEKQHVALRTMSSRRPLFRDMASPNLSRNFADPMEELIHCFATSLIH